MGRALRMAGLGPEKVAAAELYDAYAGAELQAIEALDLSADPLRDLSEGRFEAGGALPVNLSGGLLGQGAPPGATGVAQAAACASSWRGATIPGSSPRARSTSPSRTRMGGLCTTAAVALIGNAA
jgi:acetyl-CoA C-acetyltransferase